MWINYFKASFRFLKRYKGYTLLNLLGLSIGIASSIFIFLWVLDELSYDKFHKDYKNIARLVQTDQFNTNDAVTPAPYAPILAEKIPEIKNYFRLRPYTSEALIEYQNKKYYEKNILFSDSTILKVLSFDFIYGDESALNETNSIVITESTAKKYFGNKNPFGEIIKINTKNSLKVTGVIKDFPQNSHIHFDFLMPLEFIIQEGYSVSWFNWFYYTYFFLSSPMQHLEILSDQLG